MLKFICCFCIIIKEYSKFKLEGNNEESIYSIDCF